MKRKLALAACVVVFVLIATALAQEPAAKSKPLSADDVAKLVELGIDDSTIVAKIKKAGLTFTLSDGVRQRLSDAGVSGTVIDAIAAAPSPRGIG